MEKGEYPSDSTLKRLRKKHIKNEDKKENTSENATGDKNGESKTIANKSSKK